MADDNFNELFKSMSKGKALPNLSKNTQKSNKQALPDLKTHETTQSENKYAKYINPTNNSSKPSNPYAKYINRSSHSEQSNHNNSHQAKAVDNKQTSSTNNKPTDIHVPLHKKGTDKMVVTNDGKTLDEVLAIKRHKRSNIENLVHDFKELPTVNGKHVSDDRYTKYRDKFAKKDARDESKRKLSNKFVRKNARYTQDEQIIMDNLGIPMNDLVDKMKTPTLTKGDKMKILKYGTKGMERYYKGKRFRVTHADNEMIDFLAKFKFASTRILSLLRGEAQSVTNRRLHRMKRSGLTADYEVPGMGTIWCLTEIGMAISGYDLKTYRQRRPKMSIMPPVIGINYVAACLWHNKYNVLFLPDYPAKNFIRHGADGKQWKLPGETLVSELEIRSSYGKELRPKGSSFTDGIRGSQEQIIQNAHLIWHQWDKNGRNPDSPEFELGNEYLWIVFPENSLSVDYHVPDLVISRPRKADGSPQSIAVECELSHKSVQTYKRTMQAYKDDKYIYDRVIWITNDSRITRAIQKAADEVGNTNYDIVPFTNKNGIYKDRDIWYI